MNESNFFVSCLNSSTATSVDGDSFHKNEAEKLDISFNSSNESFYLHESQPTRKIENMQHPVHRQTQQMVNHSLKHNQSYQSLEGMARIMNMMDNASIRVSETKYKILKMILRVHSIRTTVEAFNL